MTNIYLLPNKFRFIGIFSVLVGIVLSVIRFLYEVKPEYLNQKVFAVYSSFLEKSYFTVTTNNIFEEICGITILLGLFMIVFSKEKNENDKIQEIRFYSIMYSVYANFFIVLFSLIFIYGLGFIYFLVLNMYLVLIMFIVIFRYLLYQKSQKLTPNN